MSKITNEDNIKEKLNYIGLDLENIPEFLTNSKEIDYKPLKAYEDNGYRVYKYIPISKIQILLSKTNRLNTIKEKYSKAFSIKQYLKPENEEDMLKHTTFLKMLKDVQIEDIEKLIVEQEKLNKQIPFKVKFEENYLWQIYYSDIDDTYFMIVPTEDLEYASFFYLLKKQIEYHKTKKEQMIFVPISYQNYSNDYLKNSEIADIEKYLWFFTKNWSNIYDVYDKKGNLSLQIIGETVLYDNLTSFYKNTLKDKVEALKFYKLLKALFILATELPHYYKFIAKINRYGALEFRYDGKVITYDNMLTMLEENYVKAMDDIINFEKEKNELEKIINDLKELLNKKDKEYLLKEKQIATYLECRKTFFGRVKYFFKAKKNKKTRNTVIEENEVEDNVTTKRDEEIATKFTKKEFYTIEDIVKIYKELDIILNTVKNLKMDEKALNTRVSSMETKIKNANLYIEEIDKHEKSIFEFWKFANKDENLMLNEGNIEEKVISKKIEKVYNYNEDEEEIGKIIDKVQRSSLSKENTDAIYVATTDVLYALNNIDDDNILSESLSKLKKEVRK